MRPSSPSYFQNRGTHQRLRNNSPHSLPLPVSGSFASTFCLCEFCLLYICYVSVNHPILKIVYCGYIVRTHTHHTLHAVLCCHLVLVLWITVYLLNTSSPYINVSWVILVVGSSLSSRFLRKVFGVSIPCWQYPLSFALAVIVAVDVNSMAHIFFLDYIKDMTSFV